MSDNLTRREQETLHVLHDKGAAKPSLISDELGIRRQNAYQHLQTLVETGRAERLSHGLYTPIGE